MTDELSTGLHVKTNPNNAEKGKTSESPKFGVRFTCEAWSEISADIGENALLRSGRAGDP